MITYVSICNISSQIYQNSTKLEQLEHLLSEDIPHRLMITHSI